MARRHVTLQGVKVLRIGGWGLSFGVGEQMKEGVVNEKMMDLISDTLGLRKM